MVRVRESKRSFPLSPLCGVVCAASTPPMVTCDIQEAQLPAWLTGVSSPSSGHAVWLKAPHPVNHIAGADCQAGLRTQGSKVTRQANPRARSQTRPFSGTHGVRGPRQPAHAARGTSLCPWWFSCHLRPLYTATPAGTEPRIRACSPPAPASLLVYMCVMLPGKGSDIDGGKSQVSRFSISTPDRPLPAGCSKPEFNRNQDETLSAGTFPSRARAGLRLGWGLRHPQVLAEDLQRACLCG